MKCNYNNLLTIARCPQLVFPLRALRQTPPGSSESPSTETQQVTEYFFNLGEKVNHLLILVIGR